VDYSGGGAPGLAPVILLILFCNACVIMSE
jgi:hypothetical protein